MMMMMMRIQRFHANSRWESSVPCNCKTSKTSSTLSCRQRRKVQFQAQDSAPSQCQYVRLGLSPARQPITDQRLWFASTPGVPWRIASFCTTGNDPCTSRTCSQDVFGSAVGHCWSKGLSMLSMAVRKRRTWVLTIQASKRYNKTERNASVISPRNQWHCSWRTHTVPTTPINQKAMSRLRWQFCERLQINFYFLTLEVRASGTSDALQAYNAMAPPGYERVSSFVKWDASWSDHVFVVGRNSWACWGWAGTHTNHHPRAGFATGRTPYVWCNYRDIAIIRGGAPREDCRGKISRSMFPNFPFLEGLSLLVWWFNLLE